MKLFLVLIILIPITIFSQQQDSLLLKLKNHREAGTLDSIEVRNSFKYQQFNYIDSITTFYIRTDTINDSTGVYSIGNVIIDPFVEYNGIKVGLWIEYYSTGQIKSEGIYSIDAIVWCQFGGPIVCGYSYKSGTWTYYHNNGQIEAKGKYLITQQTFENNCGGDFYLESSSDSTWLYWDINGQKNIEPKSY